MCENRATNAGMTLNPGGTWHKSNLTLHGCIEAQCLAELTMTLALIAANVRAETMLAGGCLSTARADSQAAANLDPRSKRRNEGLFGRLFGSSDRGGYGELEGWRVGGLEGWRVGRRGRW